MGKWLASLQDRILDRKLTIGMGWVKSIMAAHVKNSTADWVEEVNLTVNTGKHLVESF